MTIKEDFIARMAKKGYTKKDAGIFIDDFFQTFAEILKSGEDKIRFTNFGTFYVKNIGERPNNLHVEGAPDIIPAHQTLGLSPSKNLKNLLNDGG